MRRKLWVASISLLAIAAAAVPVYRWIDEAGNVHYSDRVPDTARESQGVELLPPPPAAEVDAARTRLSRLQEDLAAAAQRRAEVQERERIERELAEAQRVEWLRRCTFAQQNLYALAQARPVYRIDETGKRVYLDDRERAAEVARLEAERAEYCK
jgi:hypothetical protein